jgi:hypothetical protein
VTLLRPAYMAMTGSDASGSDRVGPATADSDATGSEATGR